MKIAIYSLLFAVMLNNQAIAQSKIYYLNVNWTDIVTHHTDHKRIIKEDSNFVFSYTDFDDDTIVVTGKVHGFDNEADANQFLMFCYSGYGEYFAGKFDKKLMAQGKGYFTAYEGNKIKAQTMSKGFKTYNSQIWTKNGTTCLIKGSGIQCDDDSQHDDIKNYAVYKDSILVEAYSVRIEKKDTIFSITDSFAMPIDGINKFREEIVRRLKYPMISMFLNQQGTVIITFVVDKEGNLVDFEALNTKYNKYNILEQRAIKALQKLPKWNPAKINGKPVKVKFNLPIRYEI